MLTGTIGDLVLPAAIFLGTHICVSGTVNVGLKTGQYVGVKTSQLRLI